MGVGGLGGRERIEVCWERQRCRVFCVTGRPAILAAAKGRGGCFFISSVSSLSLILLYLPCPSLSSPLLSLLSLFSFCLGDDTMTSRSIFQT